MLQPLVESIYEAAFIPECWTSVLESLRIQSGSASGSMLVFDGHAPPRWKTTARTQVVLEKFATTDAWTKSERDPKRLSEADRGDHYFHCLNDLMTAEQLERDTARQLLEEAGVAWQIGTTIPMPTDEHVVFTFEREIADGRHLSSDVQQLSVLRPHLARAGLIASRLGLERARGALDAMSSIGLPAALLDQTGRLREINALMHPDMLGTRAGGKLTLGSATADDALDLILRGASISRSIALPGAGAKPGRVIHVLPLAGGARDIFSGSLWMIVMNVSGAMPRKPDATIIRALFDLSPAESRLAAALSTGTDLAASAADCGIKLSTARSYLERIFAKVGVHRQSELVALIAGSGILMRC